MLYRKYKAIAYEDRTRKTCPSNGYETDSIAMLYKFIRQNCKYNETYELICRDTDDVIIVYPEQANDIDTLLEILSKFEEVPE